MASLLDIHSCSMVMFKPLQLVFWSAHASIESCFFYAILESEIERKVLEIEGRTWVAMSRTDPIW